MAETETTKPAKARKKPDVIPPELLGRNKRYRESYKNFIPDRVDLAKGVEILKSFKPTKFDQSVEVIFKLGIDPKQADQMIRTSVSVPNGIGRNKRVVAFVSENLVPLALENGAIRAGSQQLVEEVEKTSFTDFDVAIATPDMMRFVGRLGKVLGPKGLMPSPKAGTVTTDVATAVREYTAGKMELRNDAGGNVHTVVGRLSFADDKLIENIQSMIVSIRKLRPQTSKGQFIQKVVLKSSMSPAVYLRVE